MSPAVSRIWRYNVVGSILPFRLAVASTASLPTVGQSCLCHRMTSIRLDLPIPPSVNALRRMDPAGNRKREEFYRHADGYLAARNSKRHRSGQSLQGLARLWHHHHGPCPSSSPRIRRACGDGWVNIGFTASWRRWTRSWRRSDLIRSDLIRSDLIRSDLIRSDRRRSRITSRTTGRATSRSRHWSGHSADRRRPPQRRPNLCPRKLGRLCRAWTAKIFDCHLR